MTIIHLKFWRVQGCGNSGMHTLAELNGISPNLQIQYVGNASSSESFYTTGFLYYAKREVTQTRNPAYSPPL